MRPRLVIVLGGLAAATCTAIPALLAQSSPSTQMVFAAAVDSHDAAVADLRAAEFVVKEDGNECAVIGVERATAEMQWRFSSMTMAPGFSNSA